MTHDATYNGRLARQKIAICTHDVAGISGLTSQHTPPNLSPFLLMALEFFLFVHIFRCKHTAYSNRFCRNLIVHLHIILGQQRYSIVCTICRESQCWNSICFGEWERDCSPIGAVPDREETMRCDTDIARFILFSGTERDGLILFKE